MFSPDGILVIDAKNEILTTNKSFLELMNADYELELQAKLSEISLEQVPLLDHMWEAKNCVIGSIEWTSKHRKK